LLDAQVLLTPNPSSDLVNIQASFRESPGQLQISIVNALGQAIRSSFLEVDHTEFQTQLQVSDLTPGMYLVQLRAGDRYTTLRLVIE
ncbi:T9SS type A sorting domain-containing protein, partial [Arthrospira platensis SPKY1]|nr:T9SS type A sorting domain-containing protein [Arthrospira platensis SPKY1]